MVCILHKVGRHAEHGYWPLCFRRVREGGERLDQRCAMYLAERRLISGGNHLQTSQGTRLIADEKNWQVGVALQKLRLLVCKL